MPSPSRCTVLVCAVVAAACARDLSLPEPPAADAAAPAFLGPASGFYALGIRSSSLPAGVLPPGEPFDIAVGNGMFVVQLTNPEGGADPIAGAMLRNVNGRPGARAPDIDGCVVVDRSQDAELLYGTFDAAREGEELDGRFENGMRVRGHLVAGGGALVAEVDNCGVPVELRATRFCSFEPALSGVYAGTTTKDGTESPTWVALGFRDTLVAGLEWPRGGMGAFPATSRFFLGTYDRFAERGALFALTEQNGETTRECSQLALAEGGGRVDLELGPGGLGADRSCSVRDDGAACAGGECVRASRRSGDGLADCAATTQGLVVSWEIRQCGRNRYLDVRAFDARSGELLEPSPAAGLAIGALQAGSALRPAQDVPGELSMRFPIDEPAASTPSKYLVYAIRRTADGADAAVPPCVVDRRGR